MSEIATAEQLLNVKPKRRFKEVTLPILGVTLRIQSLFELEVSNYDAEILMLKGGGLKKSKLQDANRRFIVLCVVDLEGNRIFSDRDIGKLANWDSVDTKHLYDECASHCGTNDSDIEGLVKNSGVEVVDDSATGSLPNAE